MEDLEVRREGETGVILPSPIVILRQSFWLFVSIDTWRSRYTDTPHFGLLSSDNCSVRVGVDWENLDSFVDVLRGTTCLRDDSGPVS